MKNNIAIFSTDLLLSWAILNYLSEKYELDYYINDLAQNFGAGRRTVIRGGLPVSKIHHGNYDIPDSAYAYLAHFEDPGAMKDLIHCPLERRFAISSNTQSNSLARILQYQGRIVSLKEIDSILSSL